MATLYKQILIVALVALMGQNIPAMHISSFYRIVPREMIPIDDFSSSEEAYNEMRKYVDNDEELRANWPLLMDEARELMDEARKAQIYAKLSPNEFDAPQLQSTQMKRMAPPRTKIDKSYKPNEVKRDSHTQQEYMNLCYFKICNLGRKRNN